MFLIAYVLHYEDVVGKWNKAFHIIILDTGWRWELKVMPPGQSTNTEQVEGSEVFSLQW